MYVSLSLRRLSFSSLTLLQVAANRQLSDELRRATLERVKTMPVCVCVCVCVSLCLADPGLHASTEAAPQDAAQSELSSLRAELQSAGAEVRCVLCLRLFAWLIRIGDGCC
jgi:hypothetical protein